MLYVFFSLIFITNNIAKAEADLPSPSASPTVPPSPQSNDVNNVETITKEYPDSKKTCIFEHFIKEDKYVLICCIIDKETDFLGVKWQSFTVYYDSNDRLVYYYLHDMYNKNGEICHAVQMQCSVNYDSVTNKVTLQYCNLYDYYDNLRLIFDADGKAFTPDGKPYPPPPPPECPSPTPPPPSVGPSCSWEEAQMLYPGAFSRTGCQGKY